MLTRILFLVYVLTLTALPTAGFVLFHTPPIRGGLKAVDITNTRSAQRLGQQRIRMCENKDWLTEVDESGFTQAQR